MPDFSLNNSIPLMLLHYENNHFDISLIIIKP